MTRYSTPRVAVLAMTVALAAGCAAPTNHERASSAPVAARAPAPEPEYEPAYPAEVSSEGLSPQDAEQQAQAHSHDGGAEHTHGEKEGEDDHGHPH